MMIFAVPKKKTMLWSVYRMYLHINILHGEIKHLAPKTQLVLGNTIPFGGQSGCQTFRASDSNYK